MHNKLYQGWKAAGWFWVACVFWVSLTPHPPEPVSFNGVDKIEHLLAYAWLMLWFAQILTEKTARLRHLALLVVMGVGIEILQGMSGYRFFEYADMLANSLGALLGYFIATTRFGQWLPPVSKT